MSKYNAKKIKSADGIFDSKKEYTRWLELKAQEEAGTISKLERQHSFELIPGQRKDGRLVERPVKYKADFVYWLNGEMVVEDTKGMRTQVYTIKRKLMLYRYGIQIREI